MLPPQTASMIKDLYTLADFQHDKEVAVKTLSGRELDERLGQIYRRRATAIEGGWLAGQPNLTSAV
jgi:hypothetical protein